MVQCLDQSGLRAAVCALKQRDTQLAVIADQYGPPPMWRRPQTLATLVQVVLEQQVSLKSAKAIFERVKTQLGSITPLGLQRLGEGGLRHLGVTRQKSRYIVGLADEIATGKLSLNRLRFRTDSEVRDELTALVGIGEWTANVYLLMALRRPDIWPRGDLALLIATGEVCLNGNRPAPEYAEEYAARWSPYRSVAARMLWHWYLNQTRQRAKA
ncbi:MAG: DNA-3-methyladenine glycosylase 2 family protein [Pseudomonadota bacterium]